MSQDRNDDFLLPLNENRVEWGTLKILTGSNYTAHPEPGCVVTRLARKLEMVVVGEIPLHPVAIAEAQQSTPLGTAVNKKAILVPDSEQASWDIVPPAMPDSSFGNLAVGVILR